MKLRFKKVYNICKTKSTCEGGDEGDAEDEEDQNLLERRKKKGHGGCGNSQPKITRDAMKLMAEFKNVGDESVEKKQVLSAEKVHSILKRISDEDCRSLGLNPEYARPDWMILTILPVPPPSVRPSIMMDPTARGEVTSPLSLYALYSCTFSLCHNRTI